MGKIKLVSDGNLPQTLPTGGILMNDGDPIDFSALENGSGSNPCEDPDATYLYVVQSYVQDEPIVPNIATILLRATSFILDDGSEIINDSSYITGFGEIPEYGTSGLHPYYQIKCPSAIWDRVGVIKIKITPEEIWDDYGDIFFHDCFIDNPFFNLEEAMEYAINNNVIIYTPREN